MIRVLVVLPNDSSGGAEQFLKMLVSKINASTVEIYFLSKPSGDLWSDTDSYFKLHYQSSNNKLFSVLELLTKLIFISNRRFDYIFTSHVYTNGLIGLFLRFGILRTRFFVARESTSIFIRFKGLKLNTYKFFYRFGYKSIDLLICQTEVMKKQLIEGYLRLQNFTAIVVIPNPIDTNLIATKEKESIVDPLPEKFLVSAGRLIPVKGYDRLIHVFAKLRVKYQELHLIILGDGPEYANLRKLTEELNIKDFVIFPGRVKNVYPYFKKASGCVVSSITEGFPNVLLQMMSQNSKVVSTLCAGGIEDIPNIYTCPIENNASLLKKIDEALSTKKDNTKCFNDYLQKRSIENFLEKMNQYLEKNNINPSI